MIRGITRTGIVADLGNFWVDITRGTVRILLPLSFVFALVLVSQGVVQNLDGGTDAPPSIDDAAGSTEQAIPGGPVASQDRDQAARHQRRRLLQRQLGSPVREPERPHELPRDLGDPGDPVRRSSSRSASWSATADRPGCCSVVMAGVPRRDARRGGRSPSRTATRRSTRPRVDQSISTSAVGRQHGGQGGALRHQWRAGCGPVPPPAPPTGR